MCGQRSRETSGGGGGGGGGGGALEPSDMALIPLPVTHHLSIYLLVPRLLKPRKHCCVMHCNQARLALALEYEVRHSKAHWVGDGGGGGGGAQ